MNVRHSDSKGGLMRLCAGMGVMCVFGLAAQSVQAVDRGPVVEPSGTFTIEPTERSVEQMLADEQAFLGVGGVPSPQAVPFRPTGDPQAYAQAKAQMRSQVGVTEARQAPAPLAPPIVTGMNISGLTSTQSGNLRPPDTHGASGGGKYCQIVNSKLACYARGGAHAKVLDVPLSAFFGYFTTTIFDPRIEYDSVWNRWVVYAEAFAESPTVQRAFIAISRTASPQASWIIYPIDVNFFDNDDFWDYGQLGMTQDAIVLTANIFGNQGFKGARLLHFAKARLYNALGVTFFIFSGLDGTLAPSKVLDQHKDMFLAAAPLWLPPGGTTISMYTLSDAANFPFTAVSGPIAITVPTYSIPPDADQFGTTDQLSTVDGRFVNRSTQIGDSLFNAHTVAFTPTGSAFAAPELYEIDTSTNTLAFSDKWFQAGSSDDFNVSVGVEALPAPNPAGLATPGDLYVTWTSTDPTSYNARMVVSGEQPPYTQVQVPGPVCATSSTFYNPSADTVERWGDYSSGSLTVTGQAAEMVNETIVNQSTWGSQICRVKY